MDEYEVTTTDNCATVVELCRQRALFQPDKRAYTFLADGEAKEVHRTYAELDQQARAIGTVLQRHKAAGERVLLIYPPSLEFIAGIFGCLYAGSVAVPLSLQLEGALPRLQAILKDARPIAVLSTTRILDLTKDIRAQEPALQRLPWLATDGLGVSSISTAAYSDRVEGEEQILSRKWKDPAVSWDTPAVLQYTSGSTAEPKGALLTHGNILSNARMIKTACRHTSESTFVGWEPLYHDMGLFGNVIQPLYLGSLGVLMSPLHFLQRPFRWLAAVSRYKAHTSGGPNFAYDLCVRKITPEQRSTLDLSHWKIAFNGAEPVRHQTIERFAATFESCGFRREAFFPCYGMAETTLFVTGGPRETTPVFYSVSADALAQGQVKAASAKDQHVRTLVGCGQTWLGDQVVIVDPNSMVPCAPDQVGEIWVNGGNVAQGYWNQPEETARTFGACLADSYTDQARHFLRTGDLGFLKDGQLFIAGRIKDLIIVDGLNRYPQDIELTVEQSHPEIRPGCSAAFSIDDGVQEQLVIIAEIGRGKGAVSADPEQVTKAIRRAVSAQHGLAAHAIVLVKARTIPKTSSGKVRRHACRAGFLAGTLRTWNG